MTYAKESIMILAMW